MDGLLPENHDFWGIDAAPLHPLLDHRHSYPCRDEACLVQLSTLGHPALGRFNDDAGRLFSLHHSMHQSWSARIFDSFKKLISWAKADWNTCRERARLDYQPLFGKMSPHSFPERAAGRVRFPLLVSANDVTACRFSYGKDCGRNYHIKNWPIAWRSDFDGPETLGEILESEGTQRFVRLFVVNFSFNDCCWRDFASSRIFSRRFRSR